MPYWWIGTSFNLPMKPIPLLLPALLAAATLAHSQDDATRQTATAPTRAHLPDKIPDGTPPPPQAPKPVWTVPAADIVIIVQ
jgi:hypothetical protein